MSNVGYDSADWGMDGWYRRQEEADARQDHVESCVDTYYDDCVGIADSIAHQYYNCNGEDYYESDEEFLADDDGCWAEWLLDEAKKQGEHCATAMEELIEHNEPFTRPEYVLEVIRR